MVETVTGSLESETQEPQGEVLGWVVCKDTAITTGVEEKSGPPARTVFNKGCTGGYV